MIPLFLGESRGAAITPFVSIVEPDHPWNLHDSRDQAQDISWATIRSDEQHDIELAPAHQVGDVAPCDLKRADVAEDLPIGPLIKEHSRLCLQRRLPSRQLIVAGRCLHLGDASSANFC